MRRAIGRAVGPEKPLGGLLEIARVRIQRIGRRVIDALFVGGNFTALCKGEAAVVDRDFTMSCLRSLDNLADNGNGTGSAVLRWGRSLSGRTKNNLKSRRIAFEGTVACLQDPVILTGQGFHGPIENS